MLRSVATAAIVLICMAGGTFWIEAGRSDGRTEIVPGAVIAVRDRWVWLHSTREDKISQAFEIFSADVKIIFRLNLIPVLCMQKCHMV